MLAGLLVIAFFCLLSCAIGIFALLNVLKYETIFSTCRALLDDHDKLNTKINSLNGRLNRTAKNDQMEDLVAKILAQQFNVQPEEPEELDFED